MSKMRLRRIGVLSAGIVCGVLYAILGLMIGVPVSGMALLGAAAAKDASAGASSMLFGAAAVIIIPLLYGGMAFVMGCIMAGLYNLVAAMTGGVEVTIE